MAQTCTTANDVLWNGLGAAIVGGATAALVAIAVVLATRRYERRHVREQEARTAARQMLRASKDYLDTIRRSYTSSPEDKRARADAHWDWATEAIATYGSVHPIAPKLADRILVAMKRVSERLGQAEALGDSADQQAMRNAINALAAAVMELEAIIVDWIGAGVVREFAEVELPEVQVVPLG
jgi:hypothetical protein